MATAQAFYWLSNLTSAASILSYEFSALPSSLDLVGFYLTKTWTLQLGLHDADLHPLVFGHKTC
jgi:hypothetical protein